MRKFADNHAQPSNVTDNERGVSMIEAALILPIIMGLFFAIVQYGFIFGAFISLRNGAAVAVRSLAIAETSEVSNLNLPAIVSQGNDTLLDPNNITITTQLHRSVSLGGVAGNSRLVVELELPLFFPMVVPQADTNGNITMTVDLYARAN